MNMASERPYSKVATREVDVELTDLSLKKLNDFKRFEIDSNKHDNNSYDDNEDNDDDDDDDDDSIDYEVVNNSIWQDILIAIYRARFAAPICAFIGFMIAYQITISPYTAKTAEKQLASMEELVYLHYYMISSTHIYILVSM